MGRDWVGVIRKWVCRPVGWLVGLPLLGGGTRLTPFRLRVQGARQYQCRGEYPGSHGPPVMRRLYPASSARRRVVPLLQHWEFQ
jgi:hypothetical protein